MEYRDVLIVVAEDCPAERGLVPPMHGAWPTVAALHYQLLSAKPYVLTQEDVQFQTWLARQERKPTQDEAVLRARFFERPQACMRSSPLPKRYGWGIHFDAAGRAALHAVDSERYAALADDATVSVLKAFRARRAQRA